MFRLPFYTLLLLLAVLLIHPVACQTTASGSFIPTVPATAATPTATGAGATTDTLSNTTTGIVCPPMYHNCAVISRPDACCTLDQVCMFDDANNIACCPFRTTCVGKMDTSSVERNSLPPTLRGLTSSSFATGIVAVAAVYWLRGQFVMP